MNLRLLVVLGFALTLTTGCSEVSNSSGEVSFKTYDSIFEDTTGHPDDQGDTGLIGTINNGDNGALGGDGGPNSGDGGLSNGGNTGDGGATGGNSGGSANINLGLGIWTNNGTDQPDGGLMGGNTGDGGNTGSTVGGNAGRPADDNVLVGMNVKKMCQAGEIDILRAVLSCQTDQNLIVTMKDELGEQLLENFGSVSSNGGDVEALLDKLKAMQLDGAMAGTVLGVFVCIDHNANNSCEDEEVTDLNEFNDIFLYSVKEMIGNESRRERAIENICAEDKLGVLVNGLVVYHQEFVDKTADIQSSCVDDRTDVAKEMAKHIKNITEENEAVDFEQGTQFALTLVESDKVTCAEVGARLHGCFIAGTEINIGRDLKLPIEEIRAGDNVLLSSGKKSQVVKVISGPESKPVVKLELVTGESLTVTQTHPMLTELGVIQAKDLSIGSRLLTAKGQWATLASISTEKYDGHVFNIELAGSHESDHLIYGNGVVTGDLYLQQRLQDKPTPGIHFTLNY